MADETRNSTGPLTSLQMRVVKYLAEGLRHSEIGEQIGRSKTHVSLVAGAARRKMGCETLAEMVGRYTTAEAYLSAAELLESSVGQYSAPTHAAFDHTEHVVVSLARLLRERALHLVLR